MKTVHYFMVFLLVLLVSVVSLGASCAGDDDDDNSFLDDDTSDDDASDDDAADDDAADDDAGDDDAADDDAADDDAADDDVADDDSADLDSIYDVQQGEFDEGDVVTVEGIVTSPLDWKEELFFLQDEDGGEYSGVAVYMWSDVADAYDGEMGDVVRLTGEVDEFFDLTEIVVKNVGDLEIVGHTDVPDPEDVDLEDVDEPWEAVLIRVSDVVVTAEPNEYGEFTVDSASLTLAGPLIVDDLFFEVDHWVTYGITVSDEFSFITGVLTYSYSEYKLEPRADSDLVE